MLEPYPLSILAMCSIGPYIGLDYFMTSAVIAYAVGWFSVIFLFSFLYMFNRNIILLCLQNVSYIYIIITWYIAHSIETAQPSRDDLYAC